MIGRALGRRGLVRCCLPALAASVLILLWPAASSAQGTKETLTTLQVVTNRGFWLSLKATGNADTSNEFSALSIDLDKHNGESTESVSFRFTTGVAFAGSSDLSSAQINGNLVDGRGSINVAFSANSVPAAVPVPKGCTGTPGSQRRGTLTGSLMLNADRLGTVTLTTANATLVIPPSISECSGARSHRSRGTAIEGEASRGGEGAYVFAFKPSPSGLAREGVTLFRAGDGFSFSWSFSALVPRSDYTFTSDLAGGTLTGVHGLHGTARYVGSPAHGGASHGRIAGNLWANFASLGAVRPFARLHLHADQFHI